MEQQRCALPRVNHLQQELQDAVLHNCDSTSYLVVEFYVVQANTSFIVCLPENGADGINHCHMQHHAKARMQ